MSREENRNLTPTFDIPSSSSVDTISPFESVALSHFYQQPSLGNTTPDNQTSDSIATTSTATTATTTTTTTTAVATTMTTPNTSLTKRDKVGFFSRLKRQKPRQPSGDGLSRLQKDAVFGVPLAQSLRRAATGIKVRDDAGRTYLYGAVPTVIAMCGLRLKTEGTTELGIFRVNGSDKRLKELQDIFSRPTDYGRDFDWGSYPMSDVSNLLRRYINMLPEPVIPLDFYRQFREPLREHVTEAISNSSQERPRPLSERLGFNFPTLVRIYQELIKALPGENRQLLLYILDLLAIFAANCEYNLMTAANLASIFQPGLLSHPDDDKDPQAYRLNQDVLTFLIENQDHFLFGMTDYAIDQEFAMRCGFDPETSANVRRSLSLSDSGSKAQPANAMPGIPFVPLPPPSRALRANQGSGNLSRSASDASASAAGSVRRREAALRRNKSVASSNYSSRRQMPSEASSNGSTPKRGRSLRAPGFIHRSHTVSSRGADTRPVGASSSPIPPRALSTRPLSPYAEAAHNGVSTPTATGLALATSAQLPPTAPSSSQRTGAGAGQGSSTGPQPGQASAGPSRSVPQAEYRVESPNVDVQRQMTMSPTIRAVSPTPLSPASTTESTSSFSRRPTTHYSQGQPQAVSRPTTPPQEVSRFSSILHALSPPRFSEDRQSRKGRKAPNKLKKQSLSGAMLSPVSPTLVGGHAPMPPVKESREPEGSFDTIRPTAPLGPSALPANVEPGTSADRAADVSSSGGDPQSVHSGDHSVGNTSRKTSNDVSGTSDGNGVSGSSGLVSTIGSVFRRGTRK